MTPTGKLHIFSLPARAPSIVTWPFNALDPWNYLWFLVVLNEGFWRQAVQVAKLGLHHDGNITKKLLNGSFWDSIHCPADISLNENKLVTKKEKYLDLQEETNTLKEKEDYILDDLMFQI